MSVSRLAPLSLKTALYDAKLALLASLSHRAKFFLLMFTDLTLALVSLGVWLAVSESAQGLPMDRSQLVTYFVARALVSTFVISWLVHLVPDNIREGHLSVRLLRPVTPLAHFIGDNLGQKVVRLILLVPIAFAAVLVFGAELRLPSDGLTWAIFGLSVVLAAAVAFLLDMVITSLSFWLTDVWGVESAYRLAERFLNGGLIPLALFPPWLLGVAWAQPFRYTLSFQLEILTGSLPSGGLLPGFAWQVGYVVGLYVVYRVQWRYGLRAYSSAGA
jgi:ABC-2 type transport system permease protein